MAFKKSAGKDLESQICYALKMRKTGYYNSNSTKPLCDLIAWHGGTSFLFECKEFSKGIFVLNRISDDQRLYLSSHARAGCVSVLLLEDQDTDCLFACRWEEWQALECEIGFQPSLSEGEKRKRGSASVKTADIEGVSTRLSKRTKAQWDLSPVFTWQPEWEWGLTL